MAVQAPLVGQKRELVERSLEILNLQARAVEEVFEGNKQRIAELSKEAQGLKQARTYWEYFFGRTNTEGELDRLVDIAYEAADKQEFNQATVAALVEYLKSDKEQLIALNKAGYLDDTLASRARILLETVDDANDLVVKLKNFGYQDVLKELEELQKDWADLKAQTQEASYFNYFMAASVLSLMTAVIAAVYVNVIGAIAATLLAGAFALTALLLDAEKVYEADLQALPEAMPEDELTSKLPSLNFFKPVEEEENQDLTEAKSLWESLPRIC